jgi:hypothetical protein
VVRDAPQSALSGDTRAEKAPAASSGQAALVLLGVAVVPLLAVFPVRNWFRRPADNAGPDSQKRHTEDNQEGCSSR